MTTDQPPEPVNPRPAGGTDTPPPTPPVSGPPLLRRSSGVEILTDPKVMRQMGINSVEERISVVFELNLKYPGGLSGAEDALRTLYQQVRQGNATRDDPDLIANTYLRCDLTVSEATDLVGRDFRAAAPREQAIYHVWPDFPVHPLIYRTASTITADAAQRAFGAGGKGIVWGVIDSGIEATHPHFQLFDALGGEADSLHRNFTGGPDALALTDGYGHGTHVAGIIAGGLPDDRDLSDVCVAEHVRSPFAGDDEPDLSEGSIQFITLPQGSRLMGMAPHCKLVSLKVLNDQGMSKTTDIMRALQYVREEVNGNGKSIVIHGVNLSLGYEFDVQWFACGQSPLCVEVNRLVRTGVVVVVAAGNTGFGAVNVPQGQAYVGLPLTINDPGNADLAITVGATHSDMPHTYGVSFFSSKGPTGDGRLKPDLVAPGERIVSCAAGQRRDLMRAAGAPQTAPAYIDDTGTSMAAPHVSGAIASFLSIRREFIGQPETVKRMFLENAKSLGRERHFEGYGMVDLMRTILAV